VLEARDFRNLARVELALPPDGIAVVGDNGEGKTNLLEAIAYLHLLRSVRGARDTDVVRFGATGFHVRGATVGVPDRGEDDARTTTGRAVTLGFERATRRKRVTVDGASPQRLSDALGAIPSVTFAPSDVEIVRGPPVWRRRFLDVTLATTSRRYLTALLTYRAALVRRNTALRALGRRGAPSPAALQSSVGVWEPVLASAGATLWAERADWVSRNAAELTRICGAIGERGPVRMRHVPRLPDAPESLELGDVSQLTTVLAAALEFGRSGDVRHGATGAGPHRDDLLLTLGSRPLRTYGSAGQQRTAAIGLRILEAATLTDHVGSSPLLLFDDPFAELDEGRARAILSVLGGTKVGQVVLAVPRASDIPPGLTRLARYAIDDGVLSAWDAAA